MIEEDMFHYFPPPIMFLIYHFSTIKSVLPVCPNLICDTMSSSLLLLWRIFFCICPNASQRFCPFLFISELTVLLISGLLYVTAIDISSFFVALLIYPSTLSLSSLHLCARAQMSLASTPATSHIMSHYALLESDSLSDLIGLLSFIQCHISMANSSTLYAVKLSLIPLLNTICNSWTTNVKPAPVLPSFGSIFKLPVIFTYIIVHFFHTYLFPINSNQYLPLPLSKMGWHRVGRSYLHLCQQSYYFILIKN